MMIGTASALLTAPSTGFAMHRVVARDDWARVRSLRYEGLSSRGDIDASGPRAYSDSHDLALNSSTFLLVNHGRAIGSTRASSACAQRRRSLPASAMFQREMESALGPDAAVVEASLTVADPKATSDRRSVVLQTRRHEP